ncbi:DUF2059 domain-containing protein [Aquitalea sp. S1-19]|uniref:DUF2059 domain-containing protein n=1 Tax=Craterilacuibacter sinensis TaxID=2686017 RepID=A0A845BHV1_9NEIS|nr:DUF2059 domain-containing protein [Craterilacuibacter sinensis]MCP9758948.1 DUF2059 domain-containing protein [Aquitalea sp. S1-19]MXR35885.1 DUF2059 domain-containing protein [Craterilacuibacter sinensis]RQW27125.1 DUF2059 domain-containing protein [Rhodobacteraceae bacterium CH30]
MFAQRRIAGLLSALLLAVPMMVQAAPAADTAAVKELISATRINGMLPMLAQRAATSAGPLLQKYLVDNKIELTAEQQKKAQDGLKAYGDGQMKLVKDYFDSNATKQQFEQALVNSYGSAFTTAEIKQITAFVKTPAGQKWLQSNGAVIDRAAADVMQSAQKALLPKMEAAAASYGKSISGK